MSGGLGDRVGHDPGQRALAQLAAQQPQQKGLLGFGRGGEQPRDEFGAPRLRPFARYGADLGEGGVDAGDGQRRLRRRRRSRPQRGPADADLALPQLTGEP